jgi:hypothetical protein
MYAGLLVGGAWVVLVLRIQVELLYLSEVRENYWEIRWMR